MFERPLTLAIFIIMVTGIFIAQAIEDRINLKIEATKKKK